MTFVSLVMVMSQHTRCCTIPTVTTQRECDYPTARDKRGNKRNWQGNIPFSSLD